VHEPVDAVVRLEPPRAAEATLIFGPAAEVRPYGEAGAVDVRLRTTNGEGLVRMVLALGDRAHLVAPAGLREKAKAILGDLVERSR
jgi:proteasome accessory factor B